MCSIQLRIAAHFHLPVDTASISGTSEDRGIDERILWNKWDQVKSNGTPLSLFQPIVMSVIDPGRFPTEVEVAFANALDHFQQILDFVNPVDYLLTEILLNSAFLRACLQHSFNTLLEYTRCV